MKEASWIKSYESTIRFARMVIKEACSEFPCEVSSHYIIDLAKTLGLLEETHMFKLAGELSSEEVIINKMDIQDEK